MREPIKQVGESHEQIRKYIRLTELIPPILELVDNTVLKDKEVLQIAMRPAVELSYLSKEEQQILYDTMQLEDCTPSHAQAIKIRKFSEKGRRIFNILVLVSAVKIADRVVRELMEL